MQQFQNSAIQNLVLDLGGVLYRIDVALTEKALSALAGKNAKPMPIDHPLFHDFECGHISAAGFRDQLRIELDSKADDHAIDAAWNALLLGVIAGRTALVKALSTKYRVILLSNTNVIHSKVWLPQCAEMFAAMEKTWFSFDLGLRKPDTAIYKQVLDSMEMQAEESLFMDDSALNLEGAAAIGMHTQLVNPANEQQFEKFCLELLYKT